MKAIQSLQTGEKLRPRKSLCEHPARKASRGPALLPADPAEWSLDEALLDGWLVSDEVQWQGGDHHGAVLGWFDGQPNSLFVYGETTGYYLTYLSYRHAILAGGTGMEARAAQAGNWLERTWDSGCAPSTRAYLDEHHLRDWRNDYHFSFDLGMMIRGADRAAGRFPDASLGRAVRVLGERLGEFASADGLLRPYRPVRNGPLPHTWSVEPGPYQLKTAACILSVETELPPGLRDAAAATWERWRACAPEAPAEDRLHNFLYSIEGLVLEAVRRGDARILDGAREALDAGAAALGLDPFDPARLAGARSDVAAQTLRLATILHGPKSRRGSAWSARLGALAAIVAGFIGENGAMYFRRDGQARLEHANVWSGMFAAQALRFHRIWRSGRPVPEDLVRSLV